VNREEKALQMPRALCRTRTGDPFLTMDGPPSGPVTPGPNVSPDATQTGGPKGTQPAGVDYPNAPRTPPGASSGDDLLTVSQVADLLQVHPRTVRRRIEAGELPTVEVGDGAPGADHWVYLAYDDAGVLLYVGVTSRGIVRFTQHAANHAFAADIARFDIEHFPTRQAALEREREHISRRGPRHNLLGTGGNVRIRRDDLEAWLASRSNKDAAFPQVMDDA
jgi:excisionase family DNA binding protein